MLHTIYFIELGMMDIIHDHMKRHGSGHMDRLPPALLTLVIMIKFMYMNQIMLLKVLRTFYIPRVVGIYI